MRNIISALTVLLAFCSAGAMQAQVKPGETLASPKDTTVTVLTLDDALKIALSENVAVKVADKEIERSQYARKGSYAALLPQVDGNGTYQRTIKKQVMYMDFDMSSFMGGGDIPGSEESGEIPEMPQSDSSSDGGIEMGRWNTFSAGVSAAMPLVNAQLWKSLTIAGQDVELAVEKARSSRLEMVTQVKQAFFGVLLAKEAFNVYKEVYENALESFSQAEKRYNVQKASELDYTRAKSTVQNAIPDVYNAESAIMLALWQLKAVMGISLDENIDVAGSLGDFSSQMFYDIHSNDDVSLENNSMMRQLSIQASELANSIKLQQYASLPTLSMGISYSINAMTNDFNFSEYKWSPYSYIGLNLSIPIFAGGKRSMAVKQAKIQHNELQMQMEDTERQLQIAVRQYLTQMETNMKTFNSAQTAEETAHKAYDIAAKSYSIGRSTITELNNAQLALTQARLGVSQAIYNFVLAKASLEQTLGHDFIDE